ncbi:ATP-NAD kinase-like domain-containing protein [Russula earlei]|uniref:ATP-NAD kinase-like domain-containing protein n=1 Tax=Russula earlei TaxID=71964 RepID=A0ACC0UFT2_9AGAM|nr:ATP-NAD kinase-like domain-containing protein [Russula earlei]
MPLIVVYNPASGDRTAAKLTTESILPLLASHDIIPDKIAATEHPGHASTLLLAYIRSLAPSTPAEGITVLLVSGDGTLYEILNALHNARDKQEGPFPDLRLILIPGGTANALHATLFPPPTSSAAEPTPLASLLSFLSTTPRLVPLTLAHTTVPSPASPANEEEAPSSSTDVVSAVVVSTALHAAILHDSEALRASVPGIERFKLAATQNATTWYRAKARLLPPVQRYDVATGAFVAVADREGPLELPGPFVYFLSTVNCDRLEPLFRIAPLRRALPPPPGAQTMDILAVRPLRDLSLNGKAGEAEREKFKETLGDVFRGAYQDGAHIRARYDAQDGETDGVPVIEYFRVSGWEWIPEEDDEKAHLFCADGLIFNAPKGGVVKSSVLAQTTHGSKVFVYA